MKLERKTMKDIKQKDVKERAEQMHQEMCGCSGKVTKHWLTLAAKEVLRDARHQDLEEHRAKEAKVDEVTLKRKQGKSDNRMTEAMVARIKAEKAAKEKAAQL